MTATDVFNLLEKNKNPRGAAVWERAGLSGMTTFGIGLTQLTQLAKQIPNSHELALELWRSDVYDAKVLATMLDEPKKITRQQVGEQVKDLRHWGMSGVYCSRLLPKVLFLKELAQDWAASADPIERRCGYLCFYQLAKDDKKLPDSFFEPYLDIILEKLQGEENFVKDAMNAALMRIGMRSKSLREKALAVARRIGKVEVDYGDNSCEAPDVVKHLTSERLQRQFQ